MIDTGASASTALGAGASGSGDAGNTGAGIIDKVGDTGETVTAPKSVFEGDQAWKNGLPPELLEDPTIRNLKSVPDAIKMLAHSQKMIGADKIVVPGKGATEEDWTNAFKKLGLPESPDKYEVALPEGSKKDAPFLKAFFENAHKAGILPRQAEKLIGWYDQFAKTQAAEQTKAQETAHAEAIGGLKKEWGNGYDKQIKAAQLGIKAVVEDPKIVAQLLDDPVIGNHPQFIKFAAKLGNLLAEDKLKGDFKEDAGVRTPKEAQKEISRIMGDHKHPYHDAEHPNHKAAVNDMQGLFQQMSS